MQEEVIKERTQARPFSSEEGIEGRRLPLADGTERGTINEAAKEHKGEQGRPYPERQRGRESKRSIGRRGLPKQKEGVWVEMGKEVHKITSMRIDSGLQAASHPI